MITLISTSKYRVEVQYNVGGSKGNLIIRKSLASILKAIQCEKVIIKNSGLELHPRHKLNKVIKKKDDQIKKLKEKYIQFLADSPTIEKKLSIEEVHTFSVSFFGEIGQGRKPSNVFIRQCFSLAAKTYTNESLTKIAKFIGYKDHSICSYNIIAIMDEMETNPIIKEDITKFLKLVSDANRSKVNAG